LQPIQFAVDSKAEAGQCHGLQSNGIYSDSNAVGTIGVFICPICAIDCVVSVLLL
jgi:hypothetical protein